MNSTERLDQRTIWSVFCLYGCSQIVPSDNHSVSQTTNCVWGGGLFHKSQGVLKITVEVRDGVDGVVMAAWTNDSNGWHWG